MTQNTNWFEEYKIKAIQKYESIFNYLGIVFNDDRNDLIEIECPIHDSDNIGNSIIYINSGIWLCFSGNCHLDHGKSILNLIKATLEKKESRDISWQEVKKLIDSDEHKSKLRTVNNYLNKENIELNLFKDEKLKPQYCAPSIYYMNRGIKAETLSYFEVGDCDKQPYNNRAIVPIRYIDGQYMGFSARIHFPECPKCKYHHSQYSTCLSKDHDFHFMYRKWYHSKGLKKSYTLYGIDKVAKLNVDKIAIVEGPGCVWKLFEFGIPAVACLGKDFSKYRLNLLKKIGISKVLFIADNDKAGLEFRQRFISSYYNDLEITFPHLSKKDVGEMENIEIENLIVSKWEKI